ncbi:hypothetical protein A4X13_0g3113 [Tilletia indica]|uniref:RBR-type E3 ubiquitin transferase n=1 Tax=Tilletia indica TaxID=43049 RepID=A0A177TQ79_9BASI|nr:hypothetical protein A4X13_0g3113 [Tilletia indica]
MAANEGSATAPSSTECAELQADELTALASILPETQFQQLSQGRVQLKIPISFDRPRKVRIISAPRQQHGLRATAAAFAVSGDAQREEMGQSSTQAQGGEVGRPLPAAGPSSNKHQTLELQHLPPLTLTLSLPPTYPLAAPPTIDTLEAPWLLSSPTSTLHQTCSRWTRKRLMEMWQENQAEILWLWADWIGEGLWEEISSGGRPGELGESSWWPPWVSASDTEGEDCIHLFEDSSPSSSTPPLSDVLRAYNSSAETSAFEHSTFYCSICLEDRKGRSCTRLLGCGHVFCSECLTDYVRVGINEGLTEISCPDPECTKNHNAGASAEEEKEEDNKKGMILDSELLLLVGQELFGRFAAMRKKTIAEADPTAAYCPVVGCGGVVLGRKEDEGTSFEALRECEQCGFAFCRWCAKAWHGKTQCELSAVSKLASAWLAASPDSEERTILIRKYGLANLLRLVRDYQEERANRAWLSSHTTRCPHCGCSVEKSQGCNHLTCVRCGMHFCFLCGQRLNPAKPYAHFNTVSSKCYQRLFEGLIREPGEGGMGLEEEGGGGGPAAGGEGDGEGDVWVGPEDVEIPWAALFTQ